MSSRRERRLGEFRLGSELGRGGMGVVFEATQVSLGRRVALKVLPSHISMNEGALKRFQREAVTAGRLNHPGIAKVYMVGHDQDLHYFAMELVEGPSLEKCLGDVRDREPSDLVRPLQEEAGHEPGSFVPASPRPPFFAASAAWCAEIADALTAAHKEQVLHRDLKPSNIILRQNASPVLVDFGLSQDSMDTGLTKTGDAVGTPAYMSPEQARGERDLDERCDVYGLGATLYEIVTLRPPFEGKHPTQVMQRILDEDVVDPCRINRSCPRDLGNIILKCLAKDRDDRYRTTWALAMDLRNFLRGEAVEAKAPGARSILRRALHRRRRVLLGTAAGALLALVGTAGTIWFRTSYEHDLAQTSFKEAMRSLRAGKNQDAALQFLQARQVLGDKDLKKRWMTAVQQRAQKLSGDGRHRAAETLLSTCLMTYVEEPQVREWIALARGRGSLEVDVVPPDATVRVFGWSDDTQQFSEEVKLEPGKPLACRNYLVKAEAPEHLPATVIVELPRDQPTNLALRALPQMDVLPGTVYVAGDGRDVLPFLIDKTEVTCGSYWKFLSSLSEAQRADLMPRNWSASGPPAQLKNHPVRNVPVAGAHAFARWRGGHLPSVEEFRVAGSNGGPWAWPWGPTFDAKRVVADPGKLDGPEKVGSRPDGASRAGALDLIGSVAELVTRPGGELLAQGGGYHSERDALRLDRGRRFEHALGSRDVGFRLAYCLPPPSDDGPGKTDANWEQRRKLGDPQMRSMTMIGDNGDVALVHELAGSVTSMEGIPERLQLPGGRGYYDRIHVDIEGPAGLRLTPEADEVTYHLFRADMRKALERDKHFELEIRRTVLPKQIVFPVGGNRYVHRFEVIRRPGEAQYHRLVLPGKARLLSTNIEPTEVRVENGEWVIAFEFPPRKRGWPMVEPIEVEFALDERGDPLPAREEVEAAIQHFCDAWREGLTGPKAAVVADSFTFGPRALRKVQLRSAMRLATHIDDPDLQERARPFTFRLAEVGVISGMGPYLRVETALLSSRDDFTTPQPMVFTFERKQDVLRVVDLSPPIRVDTSEQSDQLLRNEPLGFRLPLPRNFIARRLNRFDAAMQVRLDNTEISPVVDSHTGKKYNPSLTVHLFAADLTPDQSKEQLANALIQDLYPLHVFEHVESGKSPIGPQRLPARWTKLYMSQPWAGGEPERLQKRYVFQRGRKVFCIIAESHGCPRHVLEHIFKERFDQRADALLASMKL